MMAPFYQAWLLVTLGFLVSKGTKVLPVPGSASMSARSSVLSQTFPWKNITAFSLAFQAEVDAAEPQQEKWIHLPEPPQPNLPPKLALIMMVMDKVEFPDIWDAWLKQGEREFGRLRMAHMNIHHANKTVTQKPALATLASETKPTRWCNLIPGTLYMIGEALKDPSVTHIAFVSDDSVPTKPLRDIYQELEHNDLSRFCAASAHFGVGSGAESWWMMSRSSATLFFEHEHDVPPPWGRREGCADESYYMGPLQLRAKKTRCRWRSICSESVRDVHRLGWQRLPVLSTKKLATPKGRPDEDRGRKPG